MIRRQGSSSNIEGDSVAMTIDELSIEGRCCLGIFLCRGENLHTMVRILIGWSKLWLVSCLSLTEFAMNRDGFLAGKGTIF
jgi:hypothetical protein